MRTTVEIEDDLQATLQQLPHCDGLTVDQVISSLVRRSLLKDDSSKVRNAVRLLTPRPSNIKPDLILVNALRED